MADINAMMAVCCGQKSVMMTQRDLDFRSILGESGTDCC
jgi:hypothetical protein